MVLPSGLQEEFIGETPAGGMLSVTVISFGFKYGVPAQSDLVFDVRFLPNPFFIPKFKGMTGLDPAVAAFVRDAPDAQAFTGRVMDMLDFLIPKFAMEGKVYLNVAIGCTGGQHRSVAIAEEITRLLGAKGVAAKCRHRDVDRT